MRMRNVILTLVLALSLGLTACEFGQVEQGRCVAFNPETKTLLVVLDVNHDQLNPHYSGGIHEYTLPADPSEIGPLPVPGGRVMFDLEKSTVTIFNPETKALEVLNVNFTDVEKGIKRTHPHQAVFTYQGDGDLASIGAAEIVHAAMRGEKFTTIFVNNAIYGMTGGQMAPTTLIGQKATTCQEGRTREQAGMPIRMAEMLSTLDGCAYAERVCVTDIANINKAKKAIKKAFQKQMNGEGFTFIEVLSTCPTNWGMTPLKANQWLKDNMVPYYPLGVIKETAPEGAEVK